MTVERPPRTLKSLPDDALGSAAVSLAVSEVTWVPDVAPAVMDRLSRDAVAYPEQFDRRPASGRPRGAARAPDRSAGRSLVRIVTLALVVALVGVIVYAVATADAVRGATADLESLAIELEVVAEGFDSPTFVTGAGDGSGRLFVVEQGGRIRVLGPDGEIAAEPFIDLSDRVTAGGEQGLLGLAFHPSFIENGRFFVDYTRAEDGATVISEFSATDGTGDPASERELLVIEQPYANHNGGMIAFDADGQLLIGMGDGGGGGDPLDAGQDPTLLLGKLLRIDVDGGDPYAIPPDNGFIDSEEHRPEIHAMGLRNPWRFSVDPEGGHVVIGDVGQNRWEEVNVMPGGRGGLDFGWNRLEGRECFQGDCDPEAHAPPAIVYSHDEGCTVVGGYTYRGEAQPALEGVYLFGDYCSGRLWAARADDLLEAPADAVEVGRLDGSLASFGVDDEGEIHAVERSGRILHIVEAGT